MRQIDAKHSAIVRALLVDDQPDEGAWRRLVYGHVLRANGVAWRMWRRQATDARANGGFANNVSERHGGGAAHGCGGDESGRHLVWHGMGAWSVLANDGAQ
jgi:phosphodiesterase/alkaline phosphatase D-like protein